MANQAKTIKLVHDGREYTLMFTRKTVEMMENRGFDISDIRHKPMNTIPALFAGAFLANHRFVKQETINEIFNGLANKQVLLEKLAEMYNQPMEELFNDPDEEVEGNSTWEASW